MRASSIRTKYWTFVVAAIFMAAALLADLAAAQDELPQQTLFIKVHVWDGTSDGITRRINVLVEGNLIKKLRANVDIDWSQRTSTIHVDRPPTIFPMD